MKRLISTTIAAIEEEDLEDWEFVVRSLVVENNPTLLRFFK